MIDLVICLKSVLYKRSEAEILLIGAQVDPQFGDKFGRIPVWRLQSRTRNFCLFVCLSVCLFVYQIITAMLTFIWVSLLCQS